ncbi:MAG: nucleotide exchange factor GrpE [Endomicrobia bacterium]|nr:nucleotide exchange factor GrpE [Endomicrobiia bacterium]
MNKEKINEKVEEIINLAREEKISEEELIKEAVQEKIKQINQLQEQNKELNKQLLYLKAEFENYRKRVEKEKQQKFILGKVTIIEKMISLYEMFNLAIKSIENSSAMKSNADTQIFDGIKLLHKEFENFFLREGVKKIECINNVFNPALHEAVEIEENDAVEADTITEVFSDGYLLSINGEEYVLKPAKVKVAKPKEKKKQNNKDVTQTNDTTSNVKESTNN